MNDSLNRSSDERTVPGSEDPVVSLSFKSFRDFDRQVSRHPADGEASSCEKTGSHGKKNFVEKRPVPIPAPVGRKGEPLSLAEVLVIERTSTKPKRNASSFGHGTDPAETALPAKYHTMPLSELIAELRRVSGTTSEYPETSPSLLPLIQRRIRDHGLVYDEGTLEILPDEFGFLRSAGNHYRACPDDIYISPSQIRRFGLRSGCTISGPIRPPKERERYFALLRIETVNGAAPTLLASKSHFEESIPLHPDTRILLERLDEPEMRIVDLIAPIGFGQRGLLVAPPKTGSTALLLKLARTILANHPNAYVFALFLDQNEEEPADREHFSKHPRCEILTSTLEETVQHHGQPAEIVLEKAKRMVEYGTDVVILLDSLTSLTRAWNAQAIELGKTAPESLDPGALQRAKKYFGSARKIAHIGSLTILATLRTETGSTVDECIYREFQGTSNSELRLDRKLAEQSVQPPIDLSQSGTRQEEMLVNAEEYAKIGRLRRMLGKRSPAEGMWQLLEMLRQNDSNAHLLASLGEADPDR